MKTIYYFSRSYKEEHHIEVVKTTKEYRVGQFTGDYNTADIWIDTNIIVCGNFRLIYEIIGEVELDYLDTKIQILQII